MQQCILFCGAFVCTAAHFYAEPLRWRLAYLNERSSWAVIKDVFLFTSLASYVLPFKLGVPLRIGLVAQFISLGLSNVGIIMAMDGVAMLLVWLLAVASIGGRSVLPLVSSDDLRWVLVLSIVVGCVAFFCVLKFDRLRSAVGTFSRSLKRAPKSMSIAASIFAVDIAIYGARHSLIATGVGLDPTEWLSWALLGITATFAGIVSGMPMGLVGYDAALVLLYGSVGASPVEAGLVAVINRGMSLMAATLLGLPASRRLGFGRNVSVLYRRLREMTRART